MKSILITEKNYKWVFSRLHKFFDERKLDVWVKFRGGMEKRIPTKRNTYLDLGENHKARQVQICYYVTCSIHHNIFTGPLCKVHLNFAEDYLFINIGDTVAFLGNRVIIKQKFYGTDRYIYTCCQIRK